MRCRDAISALSIDRVVGPAVHDRHHVRPIPELFGAAGIGQAIVPLSP
jgi:hypothetical protein